MEENIDPNFIDSLNHPLAKEIRTLLSQSDPEPHSEIIIEDEENILQAIVGKIDLKYLCTIDKSTLSKTLIKNLPASVKIIEISKRTCKKIFASTRQPWLFAIGAIPKNINIDLLTNIKNDIIVLDRLSITGNIGAIIRTSTAFNAGAIVFLEAKPTDIFDRRIIRSSRGYIFQIPVISTTTNELISFCKSKNIKIVITSSHANETVDMLEKQNEQLALIFGSEKEGISEQLDKNASSQIKIPINSNVESLNVSVAASIFLYLRKSYNK